MKLWKKILIGIFVLMMIGLGIVVYGLSKVSDMYTEKIEPEMQRYVQMTTEEQDEFVIVHIGDLMGNFLKPDELQSFQELMTDDPEIRQAGIDWGRSACAVFIRDSENISAELSPEDKAKYIDEAEEYQQRFDRFHELLQEAQVQSDN
ncbi:MAG: hypothetical protein IJ862_01555 [Selenomonadaceae bacterium]|nr:hypothetical protein [Selenomonadaceae bacterium]